MKAIYRFRSADKLLDDKYSEFTRIHLADRESLNDPMEGFFSITFKGNKILWKNLFKHFFQSIWFIWSILSIKHARHSLSAQDVIIGDRDNWGDDFFYKEEYGDFEISWVRFCCKYNMNLIFERIEKCSRPLNIAKLEIILNLTAPYAMYHIGLLSESGLFLNENNLSTLLLQYIDVIESEPQANERKHNPSSFLSNAIIVAYYGKNYFIASSENDRFLLNDFANTFIDKLLYLCTHYVRLASFSKTFNDPLIWAHYADGNKGVCLIFDKNADYKLCSTGEKMRFYPVCYDRVNSNLDFFSTLFRITGGQARNRWQSGGLCPDKGSELFDRILYPYFHKLETWGYEAEERLLIEDFMREDKAIDTVNIDQSHLKGVIFGIRMHCNQQIAIKEKAEKLGLSSLKFYHALLSGHNLGIKILDENGDEYIGDSDE